MDTITNVVEEGEPLFFFNHWLYICKRHKVGGGGTSFFADSGVSCSRIGSYIGPICKLLAANCPVNVNFLVGQCNFEPETDYDSGDPQVERFVIVIGKGAAV